MRDVIPDAMIGFYNVEPGAGKPELEADVLRCLPFRAHWTSAESMVSQTLFAILRLLWLF